MERNISHLQESADQLAFKAETSQNLKLLLESNAFRKSMQVKREQLNQIVKSSIVISLAMFLNPFDLYSTIEK